MALTQGKLVQERDNKQASYPVAAGASGFQGALTMLQAGALRTAAPQASAAAAAACVVVGLAERPFQGGQADGDVRAQTRRGTFLFKNSAAADAITLSNVGQPAFVVDDETVALTSSNNLRPKAGTIVDVESAGVWVRVTPAA